jgi:3'-phosphoadenosine 5'-phosphosulfate sulfotransferase (PAPS reductase)/FAD synthetase
LVTFAALRYRSNPLTAVQRDAATLVYLRREQWPSRRNIAKVELDREHGGIVKVNPLADWTLDRVWDYVRSHEVPYHKLFDQGYTSIGCASPR